MGQGQDRSDLRARTAELSSRPRSLQAESPEVRLLVMAVKIQRGGARVVKTGPKARPGTHPQNQPQQNGRQSLPQPRRRLPIVPIPHRAPGAILLSILVPTIPGREKKLASLLASLDAQVKHRSDIELLVLRDNRSMTIGEKRNKMIALARGDYCVFVDDDDDVAADSITSFNRML